MNVAALTDHPNTPSSRFRIRQYIPALAEHGIAVTDHPRAYSSQTAADPSGRRRIRHSIDLLPRALVHEARNVAGRLSDVIAANRYDAIWLSRQLIVGYPSFERFIRKPLVLDIDDAVFLGGALARYQFRSTACRAAAVIAGNEYLADEARKYNRNVHLVPTGVDISRWRPMRPYSPDRSDATESFRIGWSGASTSFQYFESIQEVLISFVLAHRPAAKLLMMSDRFPHKLRELKEHISYVPWTPETEVSFVQSLDVGLMPIADDPWSRGKCAYKLLLYAACGVPVVASPYGMNAEVLAQADMGFGPRSPADWYESLESLYGDRALGAAKGARGAELVMRRYSTNVLCPEIAGILRASCA
ncbi:MAG: glycosyltransferase family 4 protein [Burkholderiales bacterium]